MAALPPALIRWGNRAARLVEDVIPGLMLAAITLTIGWAVTARYVFNSPLGFANELATVLFIWAVFLGAAGATRRREHVAIDALGDALSGRAKLVHRIVVDLVGLVVVVMLAYLGIHFLREVRRLFYTLGIGWQWAFVAMPVGALLMAIHLTSDIVVHAGRLKSGGPVLPRAEPVVDDDDVELDDDLADDHTERQGSTA